MNVDYPSGLLAREHEWAELARFVNDGSSLGVVWGPRRVGKSVLLSQLADAVGGLYVEAVRQDPALSLADLGQAAGAYLGLGPLSFGSWGAAIEGVLTLPDCPLVVLDEFGYLCEASPELPSVVQRALDTRRLSGRSGSGLVVCGSAVAQISHLLDRDQPLFGRAQLAQVVASFDFRSAAQFWGAADKPHLAVLIGAVVGGLAGYRDVLVDSPASVDDFDAWIVDRVLSPSSPLLEEDALVFESSALTATVYRSILAAVARGDRTPTGIASRTGRVVSSLVRPIERLVEAGLLAQVGDPLRTRRSQYELADPFLVFHDAIIRPNRTRIRRRQQAAVWTESAATWRARLVGPHFERLARAAVLEHGDEFGLSGVASVGATSVADRKARHGHQLDVIAVSSGGEVVAIGEAKHTARPRTLSDLDRLDHIRSLLAAAPDRGCRLLLFSAHGFDRNLVTAAGSRRDVALIDAADMYGR